MTQYDALEVLKMGRNIFLTGAAGSGKTFLLNQFIDYLTENSINIGVTASTGIASTHLNGRTIHSWCGIGIAEDMSPAQIKNLIHKEHVYNRIKSSKVLIIDEISMLNAKRLDLIDKVLRHIKSIDIPFGGIQVVLCGDFFQLPPVATKPTEDGRFVTESDIWNSMDLNVCYLHEQFRQEDKEFLQVLNDIRNKKVNRLTVDILKTRLNKNPEVNIVPVKLFPLKDDVDAINLFELEKINSPVVVFEMRSNGKEKLVRMLKNGCLAPEILKLKIGAVVMFVKNNYGKGYVNGTLGKVIAVDDSSFPVIEISSGRTIVAEPETWRMEGEDEVYISQIPLRLAWAITIHKSQGMSLESVQMDLSKTFEYGMGYVALSRVKSLKGMKLMGLNRMVFEVDNKVTVLDQKLIEMSDEVEKEMKIIPKKDKEKLQKKYINNISTKINDDIFFDIPF